MDAPLTLTLVTMHRGSIQFLATRGQRPSTWLAAALASQSGMERLTLSFDGGGAYRARFAINVDRDPAMATALAALGFQPGPGGYVLTTSGRF